MTLTHEDFLRVLYHGLLGREPDAPGLASHLATLRVGGEASAIEMVRSFTQSDEFRRRCNVADALQLLDIQPQGAPFSHAASLGPDCYASMTLKNLGLKRYSLPFDWIFSSLSMAAHCIADDFQSFLDPREYRPNLAQYRSSSEIELCDHDFYRREFGVWRMFNHFDPTELRWHAYLVRAVVRFRRLLASPQRKLFLAIVKVGEANEATAQFAALVAALEARTTNMQLIVIAVLPKAGPNIFGHTLLDQRGDHTLSVLQPLSPLDGILFSDAVDEIFIRRLIAQHRFELADQV